MQGGDPCAQLYAAATVPCTCASPLASEQAVSCSSQHASTRRSDRQSTSTKSAECFHRPGAVQPYGTKDCGFILDANTAQVSIESSRSAENNSALSNTSLWNSDSTSQLAAHQPSASCVEGQTALATMHSGNQRQASDMGWSNSPSPPLPLAWSSPLVPPPIPTCSPCPTSSHSCMPPLSSSGSAYPPLSLSPPPSSSYSPPPLPSTLPPPPALSSCSSGPHAILPVMLPADDAACLHLSGQCCVRPVGRLKLFCIRSLGMPRMCKACATCVFNPWHLKKEIQV